MAGPRGFAEALVELPVLLRLGTSFAKSAVLADLSRLMLCMIRGRSLASNLLSVGQNVKIKKARLPEATQPFLFSNYGGGEHIAHPPIYTVDVIDISSFCKAAFLKKSAELYASGHSLSEVALKLDAPKSSVRKTLVEGGAAIRPHYKDRKGESVGTSVYGFTKVLGELVEDQKEQKIIQLMLHHWRSGKGFTDIARILNRQKIGPRQAKEWDGGTIRKIILRQKPHD
jgi:hypothetical protein